ncbi:hypothetical protein G6F64_014261 [Rhizopus arrhizus]|uniref:Multidrug resistance protein MdtA-like C-terminal permuted SH3 domain-containing protein n=1 Tax=Rhizopus oryzae TaxID=64495 RepID=A0A9P6WTQ6_RHIOR|nr:hypothetical protein G6F64_014261 [Rhizopus arrhizus]
MTAQVFIVLGEAKDAVVVPASALGKRGEDGRYAVRVVLKDNKTEVRAGTAGASTPAHRRRRAVHHARHGGGGKGQPPRCGAVSGPDRGTGHAPPDLRIAATCLYPQAAGRGAGR